MNKSNLDVVATGCNIINVATDAELLHLLDAMVDRVSKSLGISRGCEDDRHALLLQIQSEE
jgi:hypothetical protein